MSKTKRNNRRKLWLLTVGFALLVACAVVWQLFPPATWGDSESTRADGTLTVRFLDVGQGDCALLTNGEQAVLIDAGTVEQPRLVYEWLCSYGIQRLDAVFVSHPHADHMGGLSAVLRNCSVGDVYLQLPPKELTVTEAFYTDALAVMEEQRISWIQPQAEDSFSYCGATFTVVGPLAPMAEDLNDLSLCVRVEYGDRAFLFCGDMTEKEEKTLLQRENGLAADVLKVPHHGSGGSSHRRFLEAVNPEIAVISCGKYNDYGHPHSSVLERLAEVGAAVYRTDEQGTVTVTTDGKELHIFTEKTKKDVA